MHKEDANNQEKVNALHRFLQEKGIDLKLEIKFTDNREAILLDYYSPNGTKQTLLDSPRQLTESDFNKIEEMINSKKDK